MYDVKVTDEFTCNELRARLGINYIITVLQQHRLVIVVVVVIIDNSDYSDRLVIGV